MKNIKNTAYSIARADLAACVSSSGYIAGAHHFVDLWARDSLFATLGANMAGQSAISRKTIETFLHYQQPDGLVPYLILRSKHGLGKYFNRHVYYKDPVAHFRSHMSFGIVPDGGVMTIIAARAYRENSGDTAFLKQHYTKLVNAFMWYEKRSGGSLIREWFQCEWADALLKSGRTLYTNVLYFKAATDMAWIARKMRFIPDVEYFARRAEEIRTLINTHLWTGSFYADWKDWKRQDYFAVHPNMLAVIFGLADKKQATSILAFAKKHTWNGWTMENSFPVYPIWRVPLLHMLIGMRDYHNGLIWLQPGILYAVAQCIAGNRREAKTVFRHIAEKVIRTRGVHEVYERSGTPVKRWVYRSEQPFAWSSGLFVWASHILEG
ncbi:hypothetical protein HZB58_04265 [Candidatus Gottesmanbacteria bacterium]|nr:hypothetical protein [Candidatus Gottesmanbacteria bacterium]